MKRDGRRNWRLMGRTRAVIMKAQKAVLKMGPGDGMMQSEKMARMVRIRYWPS